MSNERVLAHGAMRSLPELAAENQLPVDILRKAYKAVDKILQNLASSDLVATSGNTVVKELKTYRTDIALDIAREFSK